MSERKLQTEIKPYIRGLWKLHDEGQDKSSQAMIRSLVREIEWHAITIDRLLKGRMQKKRSGAYTDMRRIEKFQMDLDVYETVENLRRDGTDEDSHKLPDIFEQAAGDLGEKTDTIKKTYYRFKKTLRAADDKLDTQEWGVPLTDPLQQILAANRLFPRSLRTAKKS